MGNCSSISEEKQISEQLRLKAISIFEKIDVEKKGIIDRKETIRFWNSNFAKVNTEELFKAVNFSNSGNITLQEWLAFWDIIKQQGYPESEISSEMDELMQGKAWVQFNKAEAFLRKKNRRHQTQINLMVEQEKKTLLKSKSFNSN